MSNNILAYYIVIISFHVPIAKLNSQIILEIYLKIIEILL